MIDKQGRIVVPKELRVPDTEVGNAFFYYSRDEKLFYILFEEVKDEFLTDIRQIDRKNRIFIPKMVIEVYETENVFCAKKENRIYLIPIKK